MSGGRPTAWALLGLLVLLSSSGAGLAAPPSTVVLVDGATSTEVVAVVDGSGWVEARCSASSGCPDLTVTATLPNGSTVTATGRPLVSLELELSAGDLTLQLARAGGTESDVTWRRILPTAGDELADAPATVPAPGAETTGHPTYAPAACADLLACGADGTVWPAAWPIRWNATLGGSDEADAILIDAAPGDALTLWAPERSSPVRLEVWWRSATQVWRDPELSIDLSEAQGDEPGPWTAIVPQGTEAWVRLLVPPASEAHVGLVALVQSVAGEGAAGDRAGPGVARPATEASSEWLSGGLSQGDTAGDLVAWEAASREEWLVADHTSSPASAHWLARFVNGIWIELDVDGDGKVTLPEGATHIGWHVTEASEDLRWWVRASLQSVGDVDRGDAPDEVPTSVSALSAWPAPGPSTDGHEAMWHAADAADVYVLPLTEPGRGGWTVSASVWHDTVSPALKVRVTSWTVASNGALQPAGSVERSTEGSGVALLDLVVGPDDVVLLIVEAEDRSAGTYGLDWSAVAHEVEQGHGVPDRLKVLDRWYLWCTGLCFLSPFVLIAFWVRRDLATLRETEWIEARLARLERLLTQGRTEDARADLSSALAALGDSVWAAATGTWGEPDLHHHAHGIELVAWLLDERLARSGGRPLLIGARAESDWSLAALRVRPVSGADARILATEPERMTSEDEVFLKDLAAGATTILLLELKAPPGPVDLELTGMVDGSPIAATPATALALDDE